ncbi:MAG: thiamine phosphate synthase [Planctomycetota bacterium]
MSDPPTDPRDDDRHETFGGEVLGPPIELEPGERIELRGGPRTASREGRGTNWDQAGEPRASDSRESQPPPDTATVRVLDAAANRAREGLRVLEDYARFVRDDRHLAEGLKQVRHEIAELVAPLGWERRAVCRNTAGDVGTSITTDAEMTRAAAVDLVLANAGRASEALRTLEEFGKTVGEHTGGHAQQLRYMLYTLEKALLTAERADSRLDGRVLYLITDVAAESLRATTRALAGGAVGLVQLREKAADDQTLLEAGRTLRRITAAHGVLLIVNDRPDLAVAVNADGVHVGQGDMPVDAARTVVGPDRLVGLSTHSVEQARAGVTAGADYLGVGACFPTTTKAHAEVNGLALIEAVAAEISLPFFAIGGITPETAAAVRAAGATRAAVSRSVLQADDPADAARRCVSGLTGHTAGAADLK